MSQHIPTVTEDDVERLLRRDYPPEAHDEIRQQLITVTIPERLRVIAACFKNANGDLARLESQLRYANGYWRETITEAEYPKIKKASRYTKDEIHERQKKQYLEWFGR